MVIVALGCCYYVAVVRIGGNLVDSGIVETEIAGVA